jgi:Concanavalin A-like lectin/glucanases superfamily
MAFVIVVALAVLGGAGPARASADYTSVVKRDSPFAYWQLSEGAGAETAADSSGNGNTGTYDACVSLGQPGPFGGPGTVTSALLGQRTGCYMEYQPFDRYSGSYTVEAWVSPTSTTKLSQTFFDSRGPGPFNFAAEYSLDFKLTGTNNPGGQQLVADIGDGAQWLANTGTSFPFTAGDWYYVVLTVRRAAHGDGLATMFIDGKSVHHVALRNSGTPPLLTDSNHPIVLGGNPRYDDSPSIQSAENFDGRVGQVAVYKYALSPTQIAAHYEARLGPRPRASNHAALSHIKTHADGTITFSVKLPGAGHVDVLETAWDDNLASIAALLQPAPHRFVLARAHTAVARARTIRVSVAPNARGRLLVEHHTYRVVLRLWITYTPAGGRARSIGIYGLHLPGCPDPDHDRDCDAPATAS